MTLLRTIELAPGLRLRPGLHGDAASIEVDVDSDNLRHPDGSGLNADGREVLESLGGLTARIGLDELAAATLELALADEALTR
jgi:hypothetical protein